MRDHGDLGHVLGPLYRGTLDRRVRSDVIAAAEATEKVDGEDGVDAHEDEHDHESCREPRTINRPPAAASAQGPWAGTVRSGVGVRGRQGIDTPWVTPWVTPWAEWAGALICSDQPTVEDAGHRAEQRDDDFVERPM